MPGQNAIPATRASLVSQTVSITELEILVSPALQPGKAMVVVSKSLVRRDSVAVCAENYVLF
jgi:hypothetical protein